MSKPDQSTARKRTPPPRPPRPQQPKPKVVKSARRKPKKEAPSQPVARRGSRKLRGLFRKEGPPPFHAELGNPRQVAFLAAYAVCGKICNAAKASGISPATHHEWMKSEAYREQFQNARIHFAEVLESEADRRAYDGWLEPVFHQGVLVGHKRKYSDNLLMFRLKALRPDVYRERTETHTTLAGTIRVGRAEELSDDDLARIAASAIEHQPAEAHTTDHQSGGSGGGTAEKEESPKAPA